MTPQDFIDRWKDSGGAELANSQSFLIELCTLLDVPHPEPTQPDESQNTYVYTYTHVYTRLYTYTYIPNMYVYV